MTASAQPRRRAKKHRSYTVAEAARLYGVHRNTVRNWTKHGLPLVQAPGQALILGEELERFRRERREAKRSPCPPGTIYCLKCRAPHRPIPESLSRRSDTGRTAVVTGVCSVCEKRLNRRTRLADLHQWIPPAGDQEEAVANSNPALPADAPIGPSSPSSTTTASAKRSSATATPCWPLGSSTAKASGFG